MARSDLSRRKALSLIAGGACAAPFVARAQSTGGAGAPFSFQSLIDDARRASERAYRPPATPDGAILDEIDFDAYWNISFNKSASTRLGADAAIEYFHLGRYAREPVAIHLIEDGAARPLPYDPGVFTMSADNPAHGMEAEGGFAGFRAMREGGETDWLSFLGASYFRCDGPEAQYGLSARGLAIDTGLSKPEEFPRFSAFWLGPPERPGESLAIYARLDGPSVAGAYRFGAAYNDGGAQRLDVSAHLFMRNSVERLGVAPLTSMYWYSEKDRVEAHDWRPEVHDSDGLALVTGAGERLWRPLNNHDRVTTSSFFDDNPRGFGLIQRDRNFENYQDDGVFYNRRPSVWIAPDGDWGEGAVQLVEIPTDDETFDNIVAYWAPKAQPAPGRELTFDYAMDWAERDPEPTLAHVVSTRRGDGGVPGQSTSAETTKYVIDFAGAALDGLGWKSGVEPVVEADLGVVSEPAARPVAGTDRWRLNFDLGETDGEPVNLRAYLKRGDEALSETWIALSEGQRPKT